MLSLTKVPGHPIWHIQSPHRFELALTFLRMQEYQESPNDRFAGKVFTLDEYMNWYMREMTKKAEVLSYPTDMHRYATTEKFWDAFARKRAGMNGAFTYGADWSGFNVKALAVRAVYEHFRPHTVWENELFVLLNACRVFEEERFYLIGTCIGETDKVFEHELRHGLFGVSIGYRTDVLAVLEKFPVVAFRERLAKDYGAEVLEDEVHAFALTGYGDTYGKPETDEMRALAAALKVVEAKYLPST